MEAIEPLTTLSQRLSLCHTSADFFADKYDVDKQGIFPRIKTKEPNTSKAIIKNRSVNTLVYFPFVGIL